MPGFLLIDKPAGITSHDVIDRLRRVTGEGRIGHAGTLDPFATGLLIVGVGREATKRLGEFLGMDKEYEALAIFGGESDTQDVTGVIVPTHTTLPHKEAVSSAMAGFTGEISQTPPMYSAKKIGGKKLYELARAGKTVERAPVKVTISKFRLDEYAPPRLRFTVRCSSGTYVRTLAHDLGAMLGCGAYLEELRRTAIGAHSIATASPLDAVTHENWHGLLAEL